MDIPTSVKVGAHVYQVVFSHKIGCHGRTNFETAEIVIDDGLQGNKVELIDTFLHESLHAIDYQAKLKLDEETTHRLAFQLTAFLIENNLLNPALLGEPVPVAEPVVVEEVEAPPRRVPYPLSGL